MRTAGLKGARGAPYGLFIGIYPHVVLEWTMSSECQSLWLDP